MRGVNLSMMLMVQQILEWYPAQVWFKRGSYLYITNCAKLFREQGQRCQRCAGRGEKFASLHLCSRAGGCAQFEKIFTHIDIAWVHWDKIFIYQNTSHSKHQHRFESNVLKLQWFPLKVMLGKWFGEAEKSFHCVNNLHWQILPHHALACNNVRHHALPWVPYNDMWYHHELSTWWCHECHTMKYLTSAMCAMH